MQIQILESTLADQDKSIQAQEEKLGDLHQISCNQTQKLENDIELLEKEFTAKE